MKNKVVFIFVFYFCSSIHPQLMNWKLISKYIEYVEISTSGEMYAVSSYLRKIYKSVDDGTTWTTIFSLEYPSFPSCLTATGDTIFIGTSTGDIFLSKNAGVSFDLIKNISKRVVSIKSKNFYGTNCTMLGTDSSGLFISKDCGVSWRNAFNKSSIKNINKIAVSSNIFLFKTLDGGLFTSNDLGDTWIKRIVKVDSEKIEDIASVEGTSIVFVLSGEIYRSTNSGENWTKVSDTNFSGNVLGYSPEKQQLFAGMFVTEDQGVTWRKISTFKPKQIMVKDSIIFILSELGSLYMQNKDPNLYRGNNFYPLAIGNKWLYIKTTNYNSYQLAKTEVVYDTIANGKHIFLVNDDGKYSFLYYSEENQLFREMGTAERLLMDFNLSAPDGFEYYGATWANVYEGQVTLFGRERYYKGLSSDYYGVPFSQKYADTIGMYYYHSYENGPMNYDVDTRLDLIEAYVKIKDSIFLFKVDYYPILNVNTFKDVGDGIFSFSGTTSHPRDIITTNLQKSIFFIDSLTIESFVTDGKDTLFWSKKNPKRKVDLNQFGDSLFFNSSLYNKGYEIKYRFFLTDKGLIPNTYIYPDTGYFVHKLDPVKIEDGEALIHHFGLSQNYPNPFNPSTVISWQLAVSSFVILKVYDVLGNEVATLVNEEQQAGRHSINFDATNNHLLTTNNFSSGIYYYRLTAGNFTETKGMIYLK